MQKPLEIRTERIDGQIVQVRVMPPREPKETEKQTMVTRNDAHNPWQGYRRRELAR